MSNRITEYSFVYHNEEFVYLYKHVRFSNGSLAILKDGTIRFTPPKEFNDPFDCVYGISDDHFHSAKEIKEMLNKIGIKPPSPAKRIQLAQQTKHIQIKEMNDGSYFEKLHERLGVCCLNHNPLNILMWSHYANDHKGFLIEFKFPKKSLGTGKEFINFLPIPVEYKESIPIVSKRDRELGETITEKVYLSKSIDWQYEKEFRILKWDIDNPIQSYPRNKVLSSVVGGLRLDPTDGIILRRVCEEIGIDFFKAQKIPNSYDLTVPNHPRLDVLSSSKIKKK